jgi:phosphate/sulfate permease/DNA-binding CsgD family transcriptional regulator
MIFLVFLTSGLFLGWSLGANDASNIFGTAVGSRMVSFKRAAWVASIFVIIGAVLQGKGAAHTLSSLGSVDALGGAFTVSLAAGLTVLTMTRASLPVSTSQAVVGAIIGWSIFTGSPTDLKVLGKIVSTWVTGPLLGMLFSALLFLLMRRFLFKFRVHAIKLDSIIRTGLIVVGAFGAYSLGANNIANVMGVFVPSAPDIQMNFGIFVLDTAQVLFLVGGGAIAVGIFTYSHKVMKTVGKGILSLNPEAAMVVVLAQALVLFLFSSSAFANFLISIGLPPLPLVPVSSTQVVVGAVMGIGLIKGMQEIRFKTLGGIAIGWITTPVASGVITFILLFVVQNVFNMTVSMGLPLQAEPVVIETITAKSSFNIDMVMPGLLMIAFGLIAILVFLFFRQQKLRLKTENELLIQQNRNFNSQKALSQLEIETIQNENTLLSGKLEMKRQELNTLLMNISEQRTFLENINEQFSELIGSPDVQMRDKKLKEISVLLKQKMSFTKELDEYYGQLEDVHKGFLEILSDKYPGLTPGEKRLATLVRLDFSTKEISTFMNISPKSVEIARYRLRKKLNLNAGDNLHQILSNI